MDRMADKLWFWTPERRRDRVVWTKRRTRDAVNDMVEGKPIRLADPSDFCEQEDHDDRRGPNGRNLCHWCRVEVPRGRRNWCSDECVADYKLNHDWGTIRNAVWLRDHGICLVCGVDTNDARTWWRRIERKLRRYVVRYAAYSVLKEIGWPTDMYRDWWEADHIVARSRGGEDNPRNLRTCCVPCHRERTRQQRKEWVAKSAA